MKYCAAIVFLPTSWHPSFHSLTILSVWWIGFHPLSVNAISRRICPILPQRHMYGDTDQKRNWHFRAMGLGCMQHKTSNGGPAWASYWCSMGLYVIEQAEKYKHAHHCHDMQHWCDLEPNLQGIHTQPKNQTIRSMLYTLSRNLPNFQTANSIKENCIFVASVTKTDHLHF